MALDSSTPHSIEYDDGEDATKTAHYMMRWVSTPRRAGPLERNRQRDNHRISSWTYRLRHVSRGVAATRRQ